MTDPVKILHCADIHIGAAESFLKNKADKRRYETLLTFEKIVDLARENGVQLLAIAGDLFDSNQVEDVFVESVLRKISSVPELSVVFAAGNHDPLSADSPFLTRPLPGNLYVLRPEDDCIELKALNLRVYGRSFESARLQGKDRFSLTPPEDGAINLMILHGDLKSDLHSDYNAVTPQFVRSCGMDYLALGHVHTHTEIGRIGDTFFAYSGCPEGQGFDETDQKGVYMGEIGKGICRLQFVPVSRRLHLTEKIDMTGLNGADAADRILTELARKHGVDFADHLYKIELVGAVPPESTLNLPEILTRVSDKVYYAKIKDCTELAIDEVQLSGEISLKGIFVKNMLAKLEQASEEEKPLLRKAMDLGIRAFGSEVGFYDD